MIKMSKAIVPSNSTDALFRDWTKFMFDAMVTTGGWVQTADTGQINFATVTRPLAANTARGYVILKMNDAAQAFTPIFLRLDFGSSGAANNPGVWITLGSTSDGAGVIENKYFDSPTTSAPTVGTGSSSTVVTPVYSFASCDTNRAMIALFVAPSISNASVVFAIERTRNASGGDGLGGVLLSWSQSGSAINRAAVAVAAPVVQPPTETNMPHILSGRSPSARSQQVGAGIPFHFDGLAQQPGTAWLTVAQADTMNLGRYRALIYGALRTYQHLGVFRMTGMGGSTTGSLLMRFD